MGGGVGDTHLANLEHLGTSFGDLIWGPHLGTTLGDHTWGPHFWGAHLGGPHLVDLIFKDHNRGPHPGTTLGDHTRGPHLRTTLRPPVIALVLKSCIFDIMKYFFDVMAYLLTSQRTS